MWSSSVPFQNLSFIFWRIKGILVHNAYGSWMASLDLFSFFFRIELTELQIYPCPLWMDLKHHAKFVASRTSEELHCPNLNWRLRHASSSPLWQGWIVPKPKKRPLTRASTLFPSSPWGEKTLHGPTSTQQVTQIIKTLGHLLHIHEFKKDVLEIVDDIEGLLQPGPTKASRTVGPHFCSTPKIA